MKFFVHVYHVMRSKYEVEAEDQLAAIKKTDEFNVFHTRGDAIEEESAEEITGYVVDVDGDEDYSQTRSYQFDGVTLDGLKYYYVFHESEDGNDMDLLVNAYSEDDAFSVWQEYYHAWDIDDVTFEDVIIELKKVPTARGAMSWGGDSSA